MDVAQNATDPGLPPEIIQLLEAAIEEIWRQIRVQPNTYLLTNTDYRVFNYFQERFRGNPIAKQAIARYWAHRHDVDGQRR